LGDYSRETGYPKGDVTAAWETLTLTEERGKEISVDRMDDEETLGLTFGTVTGEFMRLHVIPELDAYRFAKYASATGINKVSTPAVLTKESIIAAIDEAGVSWTRRGAAGRGAVHQQRHQAILNAAAGHVSGQRWRGQTTCSVRLHDMPLTCGVP
jgi:hypothetical protein